MDTPPPFWLRVNRIVTADTVLVDARKEAGNATGVDTNQADNSAFNAGAAYVFTREGTGTWSQQAYLKASNTDSGDDFGYSVGVDCDTVAIGAHYEASSATGVNGDQPDNSAGLAGAAYVFSMPAADMAIDKTSGAMFVQPGGMLTYTIVVTNAGPSDAVDARVQDDPPARMDLRGQVLGPPGSTIEIARWRAPL